MSNLCLYNGRILTGDPQLPEAEWLRIEAGRLSAVGCGTPDFGGGESGPDNNDGKGTANGGNDNIDRFNSKDPADRIDLGGRTVVAGFCDAHVHLTWIALSLLGPELSRTSNAAELLAEVGAWDGPGRGPGQAWIVGDGFDETVWESRQLPTRQQLDSLKIDRPVLVKRVCGHVSVGNSHALRQLSDGPHTDRQSGRVAEEDLWALNDRLRPDAAAFHEIWPRVRTRLHENGVTAVHDVASLQMVHALQRLQDESQLGVRISYSVPAMNLSEMQSWQRNTDDTSWLRFLGLKIFTDGSLGAHTAQLRQSYADAPDTCGTPLYDRNGLRQVFREGHERGWQLMVHAIGDAALDTVLQELRPLCVQGNPLQHRLEHVELTPPDLVRRMAESGAWACVQPNFARRWSQPGGMNEQRLGAARMQDCNAYRSLQTSGVPLAFGSDCMPLGPLYGLQAAVHHPQEAQRLTSSEALRLYTQAAAQLCFQDNNFGVVRRGMAADLTILEGDPFDIAGEAKVAGTLVEGRMVWSAPGFTAARRPASS